MQEAGEQTLALDESHREKYVFQAIARPENQNDSMEISPPLENTLAVFSNAEV